MNKKAPKKLQEFAELHNHVTKLGPATKLNVHRYVQAIAQDASLSEDEQLEKIAEIVERALNALTGVETEETKRIKELEHILPEHRRDLSAIETLVLEAGSDVNKLKRIFEIIHAGNPDDQKVNMFFAVYKHLEKVSEEIKADILREAEALNQIEGK